MTVQDDITALRQAAQERNADEAQFLLKRLLPELEFVLALGLAAEQTYRFVDTFEQNHPGEVWARRMILQIVNTATAPERTIIEQAFQHFTTPGTANFIKAMYDLFEATQKTNASAARIGFLTSAIVNAMTAELVDVYFGSRPDVWAEYRSQGENFNQIAVDFWTDDAVAERDTMLWLRLADEIEKKLAR